ncbi:MAG: hypothetical protein AB1815_07810 [Bacillota bacterium]
MYRVDKGVLYRLMLVGIVLFVGLLYVIASAVPAIVERGLITTGEIMAILEGKAEQIGALGQTPIRLALMIALNNIAITLSPLILLSLYKILPGFLKFVPVGLFLIYAPFLFLSNAFLGGLVLGAVSLEQNVSVPLLILGLLPHAVFEFFAISLTTFAAALILMNGLGNLSLVAPLLLSRLWSFAPALVMVLVFAAFVEVTVSPLLLQLIIG